MTTDYENMNLFEAASVVMIAAGLALIGFQFFIALPEHSQQEILTSFNVFDLNETVADATLAYTFINDYGFNSMETFYDEFYKESYQLVVAPLVKDLKVQAQVYTALAHEVSDGFTDWSEYLASNYPSNVGKSVLPGVEANAGGKVMGAFYEKLSE
jgi:hypothetical protein